MKRIIIIFALLIVLVLSCSKKENTNNTEIKNTVKIEAIFEPDIHISADSYITYTIKTNLPDETNIMFGIRDFETGEFLRQDSGEVNNGLVIFGPYPNIQNLPAGKYKLDITMPIVSLQKESVKNIIGHNGENLTGPYVEESFNSKIVTQQFNFEIP